MIIVRAFLRRCEEFQERHNVYNVSRLMNFKAKNYLSIKKKKILLKALFNYFKVMQECSNKDSTFLDRFVTFRLESEEHNFEDDESLFTKVEFYGERRSLMSFKYAQFNHVYLTPTRGAARVNFADKTPGGTFLASSLVRFASRDFFINFLRIAMDARRNLVRDISRNASRHPDGR